MGCFLSKGSTGVKVQQVKDRLKELGYYTGTVKGKPVEVGFYGVYLKGAVTAYQKSKGLSVDGCVGNQTWNSLFPQSNPQPVPVPSEWISVPSYKLEIQDTGYTCGPSSSVMALSELGVPSTEKEMTVHEGTDTSGTGHPGLMAGIIKQGMENNIRLSVSASNFSDTGWTKLADMIKDPNISVIVHGITKGWPSHWKNSYGHYVFPIALNLNKQVIRIADPTKGVIDYGLNEFKQGMAMLSQPSLIIIRKV